MAIYFSAKPTATPTIEAKRDVSYRDGGSIWQPDVGTSFYIVLLDAINDTTPDADVWDVDLFTNTPDTIASLQALNRSVICYFSAGSIETYRPDYSNFTASDFGKPLGDWPDESWADTRSANVRTIMLARLDLAQSKGCDGVDPDNTDGYQNDNGLNLTKDDSINYVTFLANAAHARGLSIGLKNGGDIVSSVLGLMQWEVNESCLVYQECAAYQPFIDAGKPVFHIEYPDSAPNVNQTTYDSICNDPSTTNFSTVIKKLDLDNWSEAC